MQEEGGSQGQKRKSNSFSVPKECSNSISYLLDSLEREKKKCVTNSCPISMKIHAHSDAEIKSSSPRTSPSTCACPHSGAGSAWLAFLTLAPAEDHALFFHNAHSWPAPQTENSCREEAPVTKRKADEARFLGQSPERSHMERIPRDVGNSVTRKQD